MTPPRAVPLALLYAPDDACESTAWFVAGDDPCAWLDELAAHGVGASAVELLVVPTSVTDRTPIGAVVVSRVAGGSPHGVVTQRWSCRARRLYLPANGRVQPPLSDRELDACLLADRTVFHPAVGPVGFASSDVCAAHDLLAMPPTRESDWTRALPGVALPSRLVSIEAEPLPGIEAIFGAAVEEIGSGDPDDLQPTPREQAADRARATAARLRHGIGAVIGRAILGITRLVPAGATEPTWIDRLEAWAAERVERLQRAIGAQSLADRLLDLFQRDPEEALRYAPPLAGEGAGGAQPASDFARQRVDFDLGRLRGLGRGGGGGWSIDGDRYESLRRRYYEVANREMRLGRYRRAAYIFAHLLSDHDGAAQCLEQGRHYREAAVLYRDHLHRPLEAARCLERGGLLAEAARIFEDEGQHEHAGDLWARIGDDESAHRLWELAVAKLEGRRDLAAAAKLLETKLCDVERALDALERGWPHSAKAAVCLREQFRLLGRLQRGDDSVRLIDRFAAASLPPSRTVELCGVLADVALEDPSTATRSRAADRVRVVAGRQLLDRRLDVTFVDEVVGAVARLDPGDRLLAPDAERYRAKARERAPQRAPSSRRASSGVELRYSIRLQGAIDWQDVVSEDGGYWAIGRTDERIVGLRGSWRGDSQRIEWDLEECPAERLRLVEPRAANHRYVMAHGQDTVGPTTRLRGRGLTAARGFPGTAEIGTPWWIPTRTHAMVEDDLGRSWCATGSESEIVSIHNYDFGGHLVESHALPPEVRDSLSVCGCALGSCAVFSFDARLVRVESGREIASVLPGERVSSLVAPVQRSLPFVAAGLEDGACVVRVDGMNLPVERIAAGFEMPHLVFTRSGRLVALSREGEGRVYTLTGGAPRVIASFTPTRDDIVGAIRGRGVDEFALLTRDGELQVWGPPA